MVSTTKYQISKIEKKFTSASNTPWMFCRKMSNPKGGVSCSWEVISSPFARNTITVAIACSAGIRLQAAISENMSRNLVRNPAMEPITTASHAKSKTNRNTKTGVTMGSDLGNDVRYPSCSLSLVLWRPRCAICGVGKSKWQ